ncbi:MAG: hypothetical protein KJP23_04800 [Deltaproteobacteria bacterium]|nr:hypothetical protein [Deltaproteobacteria bacterium]
MARNEYLNLMIIVLALTFGVTACAGGNRANLKRLKYNKENELRQNWKDYTVYRRARPRSFQRGDVAYVYKLKNDKKILMDNQWIEVTTEDEKANTKIVDSTISAEILGHNEELYGYLIYRSADRANVKIIDEQTVQLFYQYIRNYSN